MSTKAVYIIRVQGQGRTGSREGAEHRAGKKRGQGKSRAQGREEANIGREGDAMPATRSNIPDITGHHFGRLTALYPTDLRYNTSVVWHCVCSCGNEVDIPRNQLTGGKRTSCGCVQRAPRPDLTGQKFGRLTVLFLQPHRLHSYCVWHCRCDCGKEVDVTSRDLKSGGTRSCGCLVPDRAREGLKLVDGTSVTRLQHAGSIFRNNTSGVRGVSFRKADMRWVAYISFKCVKKTLGAFKTMEEAVAARKRAEAGLYESFLAQYYASQPASPTSSEDMTATTGCSAVSTPAASTGESTTAVDVDDAESSELCVGKTDGDHGEHSSVDGMDKTEHGEDSGVDKPEAGEKERLYFAAAHPDLAREYEAWNARPPYLLAHTRMDVFNQKMRRDNTSGVTGVRFEKGKWVATITFQKKDYYLGRYEEMEEAVKARREAEEQLYGPFLEWYKETYPDATTHTDKKEN